MGTRQPLSTRTQPIFSTTITSRTCSLGRVFLALIRFYLLVMQLLPQPKALFKTTAVTLASSSPISPTPWSRWGISTPKLVPMARFERIAGWLIHKMNWSCEVDGHVSRNLRCFQCVYVMYVDVVNKIFGTWFSHRMFAVILGFISRHRQILWWI